jgi:hypothetical protein
VKRPRLVAAALLAVVLVAAALALGLATEPADTVTVVNERDDVYAIEVYQVGSDATVDVKRADGTTTTQRPEDVESLDDVTTIRVPANTSRSATIVFPNGTASLNATETGSRFVYVVHDGDPDGRTYVGVGLVDCGDDGVAANLTIAETGTRLEPNPCE